MPKCYFCHCACGPDELVYCCQIYVCVDCSNPLLTGEGHEPAAHNHKQPVGGDLFST